MVNYGQLSKHDFWLTRLFPRTKSRVNQGVGVCTIFSGKLATLTDTDLPDVAVLSDLSDLWPHLNSEHDWDVKTPDAGPMEPWSGLGVTRFT